MTFTTRALLLTGAAICTGWGAAPVLAQEAVELDTIRVESDAAQDVLGNTRISDEEIEERNAQTIADVFDGQTEITASGENLSCRASTVLARSERSRSMSRSI